MTDLSLTELLRLDSGNYGRYRRGELDPWETTTWDQSHERAWQAADEIDALALVISNAPHGKLCGYWQYACTCWKSTVPSASRAEHDAEVRRELLLWLDARLDAEQLDMAAEHFDVEVEWAPPRSARRV